MNDDQHAIVTSQFGQQAGEYVTSAVHAAGPDLDWMETIVGTAPEARALDLGCGGGHVAYRIAPHVKEIVACDLSGEMLSVVTAEAEKRAITNLSTRLAAVEELPFEDESFDLVLSRLSAHHWGNLGAGLREAARVLRPGGRAIIIDGYSPASPLIDTHLQAIEVLRDPSHVRDYSIAEWISALTAAGLSPLSLQTHRRRLDFISWTQRMRTPDTVAQSIRYLQSKLPQSARAHFAIEDDGSFKFDTLCVETIKK